MRQTTHTSWFFLEGGWEVVLFAYRTALHNRDDSSRNANFQPKNENGVNAQCTPKTSSQLAAFRRHPAGVGLTH